MTNMTTRSQIAAADLARIAAELASANEDLAMLDRLKSAQDRVNRLTSQHAKAAKEFDRLVAADAKEAEAKRLASISDVLVTEHPETVREHVLRASFTIHWTQPTWDGRESLPKRHSTDFCACPPEVLEYLINRSPERIPAKIMALAPEHPWEAMGRYFRGLKRGCLVG